MIQAASDADLTFEVVTASWYHVSSLLHACKVTACAGEQHSGTRAQGVRLYSTDQSYFLLVQSTGEVALFNTAQYAIYGPSPLATAWRSQTFSLNAPFSLVMQGVGPRCAAPAFLLTSNTLRSQATAAGCKSVCIVLPASAGRQPKLCPGHPAGGVLRSLNLTLS